MELYLVRHTTPSIEKGICYGQSDLGITNTFEQEVEKIHQQIKLHKNVKIYSSPLYRCKILAETFGKPVIIDSRLQELNFGDWEMKPWDKIPKTESDPWMKDFVNIQVPNGESYIQLQQRVLDFFTTLNPIEQQVIIVSHAGPIRAYLAYRRKIDLKDSFAIKINYGDVFKVSSL